MRKRLSILTVVCVSVLISGCSSMEEQLAEDAPIVESEEQLDVGKITDGITLVNIGTQKLELEHVGVRFKGVEYEVHFEIQNEITDEETLKRIQVEVAFRGKTQELMGVERLNKSLKLRQAEEKVSTYVIRVPSVYRMDYTEEEMLYLIDHTNEVHLNLYIDDQKVRSLL